MKILVVDDEEPIRRLCARILQGQNFTPVLAENGNEALTLYRALSAEICLTLSDMTMPTMGGAELARNILALRPSAPVILMTGFSPDGFPPDDLKSCAVLSKPFTPAQLLAAVKGQMESAGAAQCAARNLCP